MRRKCLPHEKDFTTKKKYQRGTKYLLFECGHDALVRGTPRHEKLVRNVVRERRQVGDLRLGKTRQLGERYERLGAKGLAGICINQPVSNLRISNRERHSASLPRPRSVTTPWSGHGASAAALRDVFGERSTKKADTCMTHGIEYGKTRHEIYQLFFCTCFSATRS